VTYASHDTSTRAWTWCYQNIWKVCLGKTLEVTLWEFSRKICFLKGDVTLRAVKNKVFDYRCHAITLPKLHSGLRSQISPKSMLSIYMYVRYRQFTQTISLNKKMLLWVSENVQSLSPHPRNPRLQPSSAALVSFSPSLLWDLGCQSTCYAKLRLSEGIWTARCVVEDDVGLVL